MATKGLMNSSMQIWLFFLPGVGGDGLANLLERSPDVTPIDGNKIFWRAHRIVDDSLKFHAPTPDVNGCFRRNHRFDSSTNKMVPEYVNLVRQKSTVIIASHDTDLSKLESSDCQDILRQDQLCILLTSKNMLQDYQIGARKNLLPWKHYTSSDVWAVDESKFDIVVDAASVTSSYQNVIDFCQLIGISPVPESDYLEFMQLRQGNWSFLPVGVPRFKSTDDEQFQQIL